MKTEIVKIHKSNIDIKKIQYCAEVLKEGGLVAFPTETVYGLGANALDDKTVRKIFEAKGRPSDNPLIVHISDRERLYELVENVPRVAPVLMDRFWPGPLTLILDKSDIIPQVITAGLDTVAVRMPSHPVALALIRESGIPLAAPSANTSGRPSPTNAKHVIDDLWGKVDVIIDAGNSKIGLESTVLDLTAEPPMILRPGGITLKQLKEVVNDTGIDPGLMKRPEKDCRPRSPGMKYTHYSPRADVIIIEGDLKKVTAKIYSLTREYEAAGKKVGILATDQTVNLYSAGELITLGDRDKPETIAAKLFWALRELDERNVEIILAEGVEYSGIGLAVMNRMSKASGFNIIKV